MGNSGVGAATEGTFLGACGGGWTGVTVVGVDVVGVAL